MRARTRVYKHIHVQTTTHTYRNNFKHITFRIEDTNMYFDRKTREIY